MPKLCLKACFYKQYTITQGECVRQKTQMLKKSGFVEKTMQAMLQPPDPHVIRYDELKTQLYAITTDAERLIRIVEDESQDIERRIAFLETTKEELLAGADYSKCETIDDMAGVYAAHLIDRLGIWG